MMNKLLELLAQGLVMAFYGGLWLLLYAFLAFVITRILNPALPEKAVRWLIARRHRPAQPPDLPTRKKQHHDWIRRA